LKDFDLLVANQYPQLQIPSLKGVPPFSDPIHLDGGSTGLPICILTVSTGVEALPNYLHSWDAWTANAQSTSQHIPCTSEKWSPQKHKYL
jgi:hypothetical protein